MVPQGTYKFAYVLVNLKKIEQIWIGIVFVEGAFFIHGLSEALTTRKSSVKKH
jgi:hypothetical protein